MALQEEEPKRSPPRIGVSFDESIRIDRDEFSWSSRVQIEDREAILYANDAALEALDSDPEFLKQSPLMRTHGEVGNLMTVTLLRMFGDNIHTFTQADHVEPVDPLAKLFKEITDQMKQKEREKLEALGLTPEHMEALADLVTDSQRTSSPKKLAVVHPRTFGNPFLLTQEARRDQIRDQIEDDVAADLIEKTGSLPYVGDLEEHMVRQFPDSDIDEHAQMMLELLDRYLELADKGYVEFQALEKRLELVKFIPTAKGLQLLGYDGIDEAESNGSR